MKLLQRAFFQPAYLRLTDADLLRHLHLGLTAQISQLHDALFPGRKSGYRIAELQPADPALLAVWVPHLVDHIHGIAAIGVHRLVKAERLHHRLQRGGHLAPGKPRCGGDLVHGWLAPQLLFQRFPRLHGAVGGVPQGAAYPQGVVVPQKPPDLPDDHRHAVGRKPHRLRGVKVVDGFDQPDAPHLKQIVQIFAPLGKPLHYAEHQPQVALHHPRPGSFVPSVGKGEQLPLFRLGQHRQLPCVHTA